MGFLERIARLKSRAARRGFSRQFDAAADGTRILHLTICSSADNIGNFPQLNCSNS